MIKEKSALNSQKIFFILIGISFWCSVPHNKLPFASQEYRLFIFIVIVWNVDLAKTFSILPYNLLFLALPSALDQLIIGGGYASVSQSIIAFLPFTTEVSIGSILQRGGTVRINKIILTISTIYSTKL